MSSLHYISIDGDDIGSYIEYLVLKNDIKNVGEFSKSIVDAMQWFTNQMQNKLGATVVFLGGDNSMYIVEESAFSYDTLYVKLKSNVSIPLKRLNINAKACVQDAFE
ncbi:MAG: mCpol domain-containing protein [Chloroflexi bacterium]|nr:mCpol domain-containing protein [Chloroflexota bacterium]